MKRFFFALWPDAVTRQKLDNVNQSIKLQGVRKLKPSNLHVTLLYMGQLDADVLTEITHQANEIRSPAFSLKFDSLEYWRKPRTICLTSSEQPQSLLDLVEKLVKIVERYPVHLHNRPYRAHVTLMRKAKQAYPACPEVIPWLANDYVLVESISTPNGIVYEVVARWSLLK